MAHITRDEIIAVLSYDSDTGLFRWKKESLKYPAGTIDKCGHRKIQIDRRDFFAHRLAWIVCNGDAPDGDIDHINGVKDDNRICNLRIADKVSNGRNRGKQSNNTSGHKGVSFHKPSGKYRASIRVNGKNKWLGLYDSPDIAGAVYQDASKSMFGEFHYAEKRP